MPQLTRQVVLSERGASIFKNSQSSIFKSTHIACLAFDSTGEVCGINLGAQRMLGYGSASMVKRLNISEICEPPELVTHAIELHLNGSPTSLGADISFELAIRSQVGLTVPVNASVEAFSNASPRQLAVYLLVFTSNIVPIALRGLKSDVIGSMIKVGRQSPCMIYQYRQYADGHSSMPYTSDAIRDIFRVAPKDVLHNADILTQLIHPDDRAELTESLQTAVQQRMPWQAEYRVKFQDGEVRWLLGTSRGELEADGATLWHGVIADITARKDVERALRQGTTRLRATLNAIPYLMFELDLKGYCHDFHSPRTDFLANPVKSQIGQLVFEFLPFKAAEVVMLGIQEANTYGYSSGKQFSFTLAQDEQDELRFELSISRKIVEAGESSRFIVISRDITEQYKSTKYLSVSEKALKTISYGVLISGPDGKILSANKAFLDITGYSEGDILGRTCSFTQGANTDIKSIAAMRQAQLDAVEFNGDVLNYRKDRSTFWNELSITPIFDAHGNVNHFIGITRDITARKIKADAANLTNLAKAEFILNSQTPLAEISDLTALLKKTKLDAAQRRSLLGIQEATQALLQRLAELAQV